MNPVARAEAAAGFLTCCVHVGMNKTGSTSIQDTFANAEQHNVRHFPWPPNHGGRLGTMFEDEPWKIRNHRLQNRSQEEVAQKQDAFRQRFRNTMERFRLNLEISTVLLSAEILSHPGNFNGFALHRMRAELAKYCDAIQVFGYVRAPQSFLASEFQQVLKMGAPASLDLGKWWPSYRERFEKVDAAFGRETVTLTKFDRSFLKGGDVVLDLADRIGWPTGNLSVVRSNESIGREAMALLYAIRRAGYGLGGGMLKPTTLSMWLADFLNQISHSKFIFARGVLDHLLLENAEDISWIERRIGASLYEEGSNHADAIRHEADLLDLAAEYRDDIAHLPFTPPNADAPFLADFPDISPELIMGWVDEGLSTSAAA